MSRSQRKPLEYFKFFWRDFNRDTAHLTRAQRDSYLQIICAYYDNHESLHENTVQRVSGATAAEWLEDRDALAAFFHISSVGYWRHKRIEKELKEVRETARKRAAAGRSGGHAKANAKQLPSKCLATEDVRGERPTVAAPVSPLVRERLTRKEVELLDARAAVWRLESDIKQGSEELIAVQAIIAGELT